MDPLTLHSRNYLAKVNDSQERNFIRSWMLLQVDQKEEEKVYYICAALLCSTLESRGDTFLEREYAKSADKAELENNRDSRTIIPFFFHSDLTPFIYQFSSSVHFCISSVAHVSISCPGFAWINSFPAENYCSL